MQFILVRLRIRHGMLSYVAGKRSPEVFFLFCAGRHREALLRLAQTRKRPKPSPAVALVGRVKLNERLVRDINYIVNVAVGRPGGLVVPLEYY